MITIQVRNFGKALGVILPKEAIVHLNTGESGQLYFAETAYGYFITDNDPEFGRRMSKAEDIMGRCSNALRTLTK
jgi:antitoxin component of MazEF toxin-antitoxin module